MSFSTSRACDPGMVGGSAMQFKLHVDAYTIVTAVVLLILGGALSLPPPPPPPFLHGSRRRAQHACAGQSTAS